MHWFLFITVSIVSKYYYFYFKALYILFLPKVNKSINNTWLDDGLFNSSSV